MKKGPVNFYYKCPGWEHGYRITNCIFDTKTRTATWIEYNEATKNEYQNEYKLGNGSLTKHLIEAIEKWDKEQIEQQPRLTRFQKILK